MEAKTNKLDFTGQNIYVGLDTHKNSWKVTILTDTVSHKTFSQDPVPEILYNYLKRNFPGANYFSAYEASYCGYWIHYKLTELGVKSIIVNPADIPTTNKEKIQKEDKRDSRKIAKCLRSQDLTPIHIPSNKTIQDRTLMRTRYIIVKELSRFKNRIKSLLFFYGIKFPEEFYKSNTHWSKRFINWIETLSFEEDTAAYSLSVFIKQVTYLREILLDTTRKIRALSKTEAYYYKMTLLRSIPGIGLNTAMLLLTELEDISRFKSLDKLCSYVGLIPSTNSSGDTETVGDITSRKHKALNSALIESSWIAIRHDPALLMKYSELCKKMEGNKAIIRIAKKLLNRIRYVMKNEQEYVKAVA